MLKAFSKKYQIPVAETSAGKGAVTWDHPGYVGAIGVTGSSAANNLAREADTVLAIGTRLNDFISGSRALFSDKTLIQLNVARFDTIKHNAFSLWGDAKLGISNLDECLNEWKVSENWFKEAEAEASNWNNYYDDITSINSSSAAEGFYQQMHKYLAKLSEMVKQVTLWFVRLGVCLESFTSFGELNKLEGTTLNTDFPVWAMR